MVRFKNRYYLVRVSFAGDEAGQHALVVDESLTGRKLGWALKDEVGRVHGDYGLACVQSSLAVKYFNASTGMAVVRCTRDFHLLLATTLPLVTTLRKRPCQITTLHVGGTIRTCQIALIKECRATLHHLAQAATTEKDRERILQQLKAADQQTIHP